MSFALPTFNLTCNVWHGGSAIGGPPDLTPACQLRSPFHISPTGSPSVLGGGPTGAVCFPKLTDIRDLYNAAGPDYLEVPAGSGRYYQVTLVDDVAKGFTNEFRAAYVYKTNAGGFWPTPIT